MNVTPTGMLKSLWLFLFLFVAFQATASHIVGGEVTYQCLGNNSYRVIVTKFRDCSGVIMQPTTNLTIRRGNGSWDTLLFIPKGPSSFINVSKPGCGVPTPNICIETARYILDSIHLPPSIFGYTLYNQGCCRNYNVNNILDAWKVGSTFPSQIVGTGGGCNNSPVFNKYPPVAFPANVPLAVDVSATDPDSDSLSYDLCSPLDDDNTTPPFVNVPFAPGYSAANLVPSSPPLSINRSTGLISGTITSVGKYSVGICITEWRNGMIVGTVRRDYQFTVIQPWAVFGSVGAQSDATCATINNGSATIVAGGGQAPYSFAWSGGGSGPTRTNLAPGTYNVTITDNLGCKDVVTVVIGASPGFTATVSSQTDAGCGNTGGGSATIAVSGGTPPYTVTWPDASTGFTHNNLSAGSHAVVVSDATNCPDTIVVNIGAVVSSLAATAVVSDEFCAGSFTGEIDLTVTSGNAPFSFLWNDAVTTEDRTALTAGNYWVAITDNGGCTDTLQFNVGAGNGITAVFDLIGDVNCAGGDNGFLSANATNARGPLKYLWSNNSALSSISGLSPGTYWVVITDSVGCSDSIATTIKSPDSLEINLNHLKHVSCNGFSDGSIAVTAHGGKAPYTYAWSNANTTSSINKLPAASYTLIVTDANGCSVSRVFNLKEPAPLQITLKNISHETCNGSNGAISVGIKGGTKPYAISWSNALTDSIIQNLGSGAYTINVTDSNGCTASASYTINPASPLNLNIDSIATASCGLNNGFASILASGGVRPYSIVWSNAQTGLFAANLAAGTIQAVVTDSVGCTDSISIVVPNSAGLLVNVDSISAPSCAGLSDGFASISSSGGVAPLTIKWSNSANLTSTNTLPSGAAYVVVIDALGCKDSISFSVPAVQPLKITLDSLINLSCNGALDGKIKITPGGGTPPYSYSWTNGDTTSTLNKLGSGSYGVTVTDARACSISATYNISEPDSLQISLKSITNISCAGLNDGEIAISVKGGTAPYSLLWSNAQTDSTAKLLFPGTHILYVTDAAGCRITDTFHISQPDTLSYVIDSIVPASCGQANGYLKLKGVGGTPPYTFEWNTGQFTHEEDSLIAQLYSVKITDANGCVFSNNITMPADSPLSVQLDTVIAPLCAGDANGAATITATGGTAPYSYRWMGGDSTSAVQNLTSGTSYVIVTDARGCSDSLSILVPVKDSLLISADTLGNPNCYAAADGFIILNVTGGNAPYSYSWSNADTSKNRANLTAGSYTITVTDNKGCTATATYILTQPDSLQLSLKSVRDVSCNSSADGELSITIAGGTKPYSIAWSNAQTDSNITALVAGTYVATITDANGCSVVDSFNVQQPAALSISLISTTMAGCGLPNGTAGISASGGSGSYSIIWDNGERGWAADSLLAGAHLVVVIDSNGCSDSIIVNVQTAPPLVVVVDSIKAPACRGGGDGYSAISVSGGVPPYSYLWNNNVNQPNNYNLQSGRASVVITDALGCKDSLSVLVPQTDSIRISLDSIHHVLCYGDPSAYLEISVDGGTKPYAINWNNNSRGKVLQNGAAGIYSVTVTDSNGCMNTAWFEVTEPDTFYIIVDSIKNVTCDGNDDGAVFMRASNGHVISSIQANRGKVGSSNVSQLAAGRYSFWIENTNGCGTTVEFEIKNPQPIKVTEYRNVSPGCDDENNGIVELKADGGNGAPYFFVWNDGVTNPNRYDLPAGKHSVMVTDVKGCSTTKNIYVAPKKLAMDYRLDEVGCSEQADARLVVHAEGATLPFTLFMNGEKVYQNQKIKAGNYTLTLVDADSCATSKNVIVEPNKGANLFFASAFTPNNDGLNDTYEIKGSDECLSNARLEIFTRWGGKVFSTDRPFEVFWDGTVNGQPAKVDIYMYNFISDEKQVTGYLNVLK